MQQAPVKLSSLAHISWPPSPVAQLPGPQDYQDSRFRALGTWDICGLAGLSVCVASSAISSRFAAFPIFRFPSLAPLEPPMEE